MSYWSVGFNIRVTMAYKLFLTFFISLQFKDFKSFQALKKLWREKF